MRLGVGADHATRCLAVPYAKSLTPITGLPAGKTYVPRGCLDSGHDGLRHVVMRERCRSARRGHPRRHDQLSAPRPSGVGPEGTAGINDCGSTCARSQKDHLAQCEPEPGGSPISICILTSANVLILMSAMFA